MLGVIVAAHAGLADALVETARIVVPDATRVAAVAVTKTDTAATYEARLREAVSAMADCAGVLLLTDMFGGTPSNVGLTFHHSGKVEVLTGANLPMTIKALQLASRGGDLTAAARQVKDAGQRAIAVASDVLGGESKEPKA